MAKSIMVQGTTSNAGKSFLAAALCRIFKQDGYTVAPFKSQNMALNSFITADGLEMGRAQVMQAEAAGIAPTVEMNPILLKPTNDTGSQVIVNGCVRGVMAARDYFAFKRQLVPDVMRAYQTLAEKYDIIVLEGAGSPAEINLKQEDIVNMGMAKMAGAPVLLCADIDRGGVFASLYGTVALLELDERARVKGLVINNFRGDKTILDPGVAMLEKLTGIPVAGVVPHLPVDLDDEDSLTERFDRDAGHGLVDIAVVRLPRISNFTDFNSLSRMPEVRLRYVKSASQLGSPDVVILPGTKNTMDDLRWLRQSGLETAILKHAASDGAVVGICGGYQMLCRTISDPEGVEAGGELRGQTGACGRLQHARGYGHCAAVQRDNRKIHSGSGAEHKTPNAAAQIGRHKNKQQAIMQQTYGQGRIRRKRGEQARCIRPRSLAQIGGHRQPQQRDIVLRHRAQAAAAGKAGGQPAQNECQQHQAARLLS